MTAQNRSSAVMQQRSKELDSLDDFPTPPWGTRALFVLLRPQGLITPQMTAREPAANRGYLAGVLQNNFPTVLASDIHDYGAGYPLDDFLFPGDLPLVDWTITNPPFKLAEQFIARALATSTKGVAMLVRSAFTEGEGRYSKIFKHNAPHMVLQFTERLVMHQGKLVNPNIPVVTVDPITGKITKRKPSSATAYCWCIWRKDLAPVTFSQLHWTGPCRKRLERDGDYPVEVAASHTIPSHHIAHTGNMVSAEVAA